MKNIFLLVFCSFFVVSKSQNKFSKDELAQKIYQFQYLHQSDSLKPFFNHPNFKYRNQSILSFASIQDTFIVNDFKTLLLTEKNQTVIKSIYYCLGQINSFQSYFLLKNQCDLINHNNKNKSILLESMAKVSKENLTQYFINLKINKKLINSFYRAIFYAYRRKNIDPNNLILKNRLETFIKSKKNIEIYYIFNKIYNSNSIVNEKREVYNFKTREELDLKLTQFKNDYNKAKFIRDNDIDLNLCLELATSIQISFVRYEALNQFIVKNNNKLISKDLQKVFLNSNDAALIVRVCENLAYNISQISEIDTALLFKIQKELILPQDFETWSEIEKVRYKIKGEKYVYKSMFQMGYQLLPDWNHISKISSTQKVKISTTKGDIILECKVNDAPVSVSNFLKLIDSNYYVGKYFHRVVPDFVIQAGCPRGDGWGSLNWTQRSEFSNQLMYEPGTVGLASLGKDSEGVQFFITHTFAPHLNGKYTIFAQVISGMEVVNKIEVGDKILKIVKI